MTRRSRPSRYRSPAQYFGKAPDELSVADFYRLASRYRNRLDRLLLRPRGRHLLLYLLKRIRDKMPMEAYEQLAAALERMSLSHVAPTHLYMLATIANVTGHKLLAASPDYSESGRRAIRVKNQALCLLLEQSIEAISWSLDPQLPEFLVIRRASQEDRGLHIRRTVVERYVPEFIPRLTTP